MKKSIFLSIALCFAILFACAQTSDNNKTPKVLKTTQKINQKTKNISDVSDQVTDNAKQMGDNIKNVANNVKTVISVFEPILTLHFLKKNKNQGDATTNNSGGIGNNTLTPGIQDNTNNNNTGFPNTNAGNNMPTTNSDNNMPTTNSGNNMPTTNTGLPITNSDNNMSSANTGNNIPNTNSNSQPNMNQRMPSTNTMNQTSSSNSISTNNSYVPENAMYNSDGTANLGNQHNGQYGCYLDALRGTVMFGGDAEEHPESVDLIYVAPNDGQNTFLLMTPGFAHDGAGSNAMWGSNSTDNLVKSWKDVNESQVALTTLTGSQFEKIQYNSQLTGAVKQTSNFSGWYMSTNKLDGKVFAIKSEMENRTAYALMYVVKQIGTSGSKGYLLIKLKVTGLNANGDGKPDANQYQIR